MFDKIKLRIEDLDQEQLNKASDRELHVLKLRFMGLWNKHFEKSEDIVVGSLNRNDIIAKYRMLLKVMRNRDLENSTEPIDRQAFKKAMEIKKVGLDIAQLKPIVLDKVALPRCLVNSLISLVCLSIRPILVVTAFHCSIRFCAQLVK